MTEEREDASKGLLEQLDGQNHDTRYFEASKERRM